MLLPASQPCRLSSAKACSCYFYFWDLSFTGQGRKQKNTAQSRRKIGQRSATHPDDFLTCIRSPSPGRITGSLPRPLPPPLPSAIFSQLVLELELATFHPLGRATVHISSQPPPGLPVTPLFYRKGHLLEAREPWERQCLCLT